jgi:hypothetical protein
MRVFDVVVLAGGSAPNGSLEVATVSRRRDEVIGA